MEAVHVLQVQEQLLRQERLHALHKQIRQHIKEIVRAELDLTCGAERDEQHGVELAAGSTGNHNHTSSQQPTQSATKNGEPSHVSRSGRSLTQVEAHGDKLVLPRPEDLLGRLAQALQLFQGRALRGKLTDARQRAFEVALELTLDAKLRLHGAANMRDGENTTVGHVLVTTEHTDTKTAQYITEGQPRYVVQ